jgi:uncharacterized protein
MRESRNVFHLAIPAYDLDETEEFYVRSLGCKRARRYGDRVTFDFFGDQLVCHLSEPTAGRTELDLYPRHFGVTFRDTEEFEAVHSLCVRRQIRMFSELGDRFAGMPEVHRTFVIRDPSDNLIEFKHYADARMMY